MKLIGVENINFKTQDGIEIHGRNLYVCYKENDGNGGNSKLIGEKTDKIFVRHTIKLPDGIATGDFIRVEFNRHGKIVGIEPVEKK